MPATTRAPEAGTRKKGENSAAVPAIRKTMRVSDIVALLPQSESLLAGFGLSCAHCSASPHETLEEGCASHGFADEDINDLVTDLNILLDSRPARPQTLTVTVPAAQKLKEILIEQGKLKDGLVVTLDEAGGFCMEVVPAPHDAKTFVNDGVPDLQVHVEPLTLQRIGGATIDFRDGRFKLDLPEDSAKTCACKDGGECGCA